MRLWSSTAWSFLLLCNVRESSSLIYVSVVAKASCLWVAIAFSRFGAFSAVVSLNRFLCAYSVYISSFSSLRILRCALLVISILTVSQVFLNTMVSLTYGFFSPLPVSECGVLSVLLGIHGYSLCLTGSIGDYFNCVFIWFIEFF